jgi:hypothetical protein
MCLWVAKIPSPFESVDFSTSSAKVGLVMLDALFALLCALLSGFTLVEIMIVVDMRLR